MLNFVCKSFSRNNSNLASAAPIWNFSDQITLSKTTLPEEDSLFVHLTLYGENVEKTGQKLLQLFRQKYAESRGALTIPALRNMVKTAVLHVSNLDRIELCLLSISKKEENQTLYLCGTGSVSAKLYRQKALFDLPITLEGLSGYVNQKDCIVVGNKSFFENVSETNLTAFILGKISIERLWKSLFLDKQSDHITILKPSKKTFIVKRWVKSIGTALKKSKIGLQGKTNNPLASLFLEEKHTLLSKKRWYALLLAAGFLLLLGFSIGVGVYKKRQAEKKYLEQQLMETVLYRLDQAELLKDLNPSRARTLLIEAKQAVEDHPYATAESNLETLKEKLDAAYAAITKQYFVRNPQVFYDLTLVKEGFTPTKLSLSENELCLLDETGKTLVLLNIETKAAKVLAGEDVVPANAMLGTISRWAFLVSKNSLQIIDKKTQEQINSFKLSTITTDILRGYGSNAYILDKNLGQVWRFRGDDKTLAKPERFFREKLDLNSVIDMAVDGSLWLLYENGGLEKYTSGVKDAYYPSFGLDLPLVKPDAMFTDEYSKNIYILERESARIVAISKNGEYRAQYLWDNLAEASGFVVSENLGKLLVLEKGTIYGINLE
ncbi:MAG: hypothetical protein ACOX6V_05855 [Patescibacteria group bacterium]|jgi:hypothetical protein